MIRLILAFCLMTVSARADDLLLYLHGQPRQGETLFALRRRKRTFSSTALKSPRAKTAGSPSESGATTRAI